MEEQRSWLGRVLLWLRETLWPFYGHEHVRVLATGTLMALILLVYTTVRNVKDTLVLLAPHSGSGVLSALKLFGVLPSAAMVMVLFLKLPNFFSRRVIFQATVVGFTTFFVAFGFLLFPLRDSLNFSSDTILMWQENSEINISLLALLFVATVTYLINSLFKFFNMGKLGIWAGLAYLVFAFYAGANYVFPEEAGMGVFNFNYYWLCPAIGNWLYSLFYILAEIWGALVLSSLFWGFANATTSFEDAKRFFPAFGTVSQIGGLLAGLILASAAGIASGDEGSAAAVSGAEQDWASILKVISGIILIVGVLIFLLFEYLNYTLETVEGGPRPGKKKVKMGLLDSAKYVFSSSHLFFIFLLVAGYGVSINLVESIQKQQMKVLFPSSRELTAFQGNVTIWGNILIFLLMLVAQATMRKLSWFKAAVITPVVFMLLGGFFFLFSYYSVAYSDMTFWGLSLLETTVYLAVTLVQVSKGVKYSFFDGTKNQAYIPLDEELRAKGQPSVETLGGRAGKAGGALIVTTCLSLFASKGSTPVDLIHIFGPVYIMIILGWIGAVFMLNKEITKVDKEAD